MIAENVILQEFEAIIDGLTKGRGITDPALLREYVDWQNLIERCGGIPRKRFQDAVSFVSRVSAAEQG